MTPISGIWLQDRAQELKASLAFCTRLPLARTTPEKAIAKAAWALPLAGLVVGLIGALVYALSHRLGLPAWPAAALTVAATLVVTGALHEDGLADTADGFGGAIDLDAGTLTVTDSTFYRNVTAFDGGAIGTLGTQKTTVTNSTDCYQQHGRW